MFIELHQAHDSKPFVFNADSISEITIIDDTTHIYTPWGGEARVTETYADLKKLLDVRSVISPVEVPA